MEDTTVTGIVEVVQFKPKAGVSDAEIRDVADALQRDVEGFPGFISRRLVKSEDGQWLDIVDWTGLDEALSAAEAINAGPTAARVLDLVETESIRVLHLAPVRVYGGEKVVS